MTTATEEARALLRYVTRASGAPWEPGEAECARFGELLTAHRLAGAPTIAPIVARWPRLLGPLDAATRWRHPTAPLQYKLRAAAVVVECSPSSAMWLLPRDRSMGALGTEILRLLGRVAIKGLLAVVLLSRPSALRRHAGL